MEEVRELAQDGLIPGGTRRNHAHIQASVDWPADMEDWERLMYCDAQTSGGLLMAVPPDRVDAMVSELGRLGVPCAAVIGEIVAESGFRSSISRRISRRPRKPGMACAARPGTNMRRCCSRWTDCLRGRARS